MRTGLTYHNVPETNPQNGPRRAVDTIDSMRRIRFRRSCVWELTVAVCRNCLAGKGPRRESRTYLAAGRELPWNVTEESN